MLDFFLDHAFSTLLFTALFSIFVIFLLPGSEVITRIVSLLFSLIMLCESVVFTIAKFDPSVPALQFVESYRWFGDLIRIKFGADGISLSMVLLMTLLLPVTIIASKPIAKKQDPKLYYSMLMLLATSVIGVFVAQDLFMFFLFWELELVPMYLLIAVWGGPNRNYASMKFLIYTFFAGAALLAGILILFFFSGANTFDMEVLSKSVNNLPHNIQFICFVLFLLCFLVKLPSFPFHTWLPDAHVEAPTPVSMLLAGVLLKMGGYGIYRFGVGFFPDILVECAAFLALLGCVNIVGGAIACLAQDDMKRVIAYSSVSHMGFILLGIASLTPSGFSGGIFQMFSHGLISAGLFMLVGTLYERTHTRLIRDYSGIAKYMPVCFYLFIFGAMANLALPALSGFVGESLVFYGAFSSRFFENFTTPLIFNFGQICVIISSLAVVLTAGYMLWLVKRIFMGDAKESLSYLTDLRVDELLVLGSLFALVVLFGVYPSGLSNIYEVSSTALLNHFTNIKIALLN